MAKPLLLSMCIILMIAVIIGLDISFFRDRFLERLMANIGIVLIFAAFYMRFLR